jgi:glycosyltransferase involved in cell wall biosynthesis
MGTFTRGVVHRESIDTAAPQTQETTDPDLSIIIPAYNEEHRLPATISALEDFIHHNQLACEVIIVDNASVDGTQLIVDSAAQRLAWLRLIRTEKRGKGLAVRAGVLAARGSTVLFADADRSWSLSDLVRLPALVTNDNPIVIGSRAEHGASSVGSPLYRVLMSRVFNIVVQLFAVSGIRDTQCGFKVFRADAARAIFHYQRIDGFGFDVEVLYLARRLGYSILEASLLWEHREGSRVSPLRDVLTMLGDVLRVRTNALRGRYPRAGYELAVPLRYPAVPPSPAG